MRVAMVTPMDTRSAIADVMIQALPAMTRHWDVEVWAPASESMRECDAPVSVLTEVDDTVVDRLRAFDLVVYVIGDSGFHSVILPLCARVPGLVVLHDASIVHLVLQVAIDEGWMPRLIADVKDQYGDDAALILRDRASIDAMAWLRFCARVPMTEYALDSSLGVVVHSRWHAGRVDGESLGEVTVAPLPVPHAVAGGAAGCQLGVVADAMRALAPDTLLVVTLGHVNANRCVDQLIEAVGNDAVLRKRVEVWAVGPITPEMRSSLDRAARRAGDVRFLATGRLTDEDLAGVLARADIAVALRSPVIEGQSASVLTQMIAGLPLVVFRDAHYADLPEDAVIAVEPDGGPAAIARALRVLVDDDAERLRRAEAGRQWASKDRDGWAYGTAIVEAGERAIGTRPLLQAVADVGVALSNAGLADEGLITGRMLELVDEVFDLS